MSAAGEELFCLCPQCHGARSFASARGPIPCGTCAGAGTLTIAPIPRLPVLLRVERRAMRRAA